MTDSNNGQYEDYEANIKCLLLNINQACENNDIDKIIEQVEGLQNIFSNFDYVEEFCAEAVFSNKCHEILFKCLDSRIHQGNTNLIESILFCFSNISLSPKKYIEVLINFDILNILYNYLDENNIKNLQNILWTINNILSEYPESKNQIQKIGYIDFLINKKNILVQIEDCEVLYTWFICNFIQGNEKFDTPNLHKLYFLLIKTYKEYFFITNKPDCLSEILWALSFLYEKNNIEKEHKINLFNELNIFPILCNLISRNKNSLFLRPSLRIFGKVSSSDSNVCNLFLNSIFKKNILCIIEESHSINVADSLWIMSNLILSGKNFALYFYSNYLIDLLKLKIFNSNVTERIKHEIIYVFRAFFDKLTEEYKLKLIFEKGFLIIVLYCFKYKKIELISNCLEFLKDILEFAEKHFQNRYFY